MSNFKRRFWGYGKSEVDKYIINFEKEWEEKRKSQEEQRMEMDKKNAKYREEISTIIGEMKKLRRMDTQFTSKALMGLKALEDEIVQAEEKAEKLKQEVDQLVKKKEEEVLRYYRKLDQVYFRLHDLVESLHDVSKKKELRG